MTEMRRLVEIGERIASSDAHGTADPIYTVQRWVERAVGDEGSVGGMDADDLAHILCSEDYSDVRRALWDSEDCVEIDDPAEAEPEHRILLLYGYWKHEQSFLSEPGARQYIASFGVHEQKELRLYVESGWRNSEMKQIRKALGRLVGNGFGCLIPTSLISSALRSAEKLSSMSLIPPHLAVYTRSLANGCNALWLVYIAFREGWCGVRFDPWEVRPTSIPFPKISLPPFQTDLS